MIKLFIPLILSALIYTPTLAKEFWQTSSLNLGAGGAYESLVDRNVASALWQGGGVSVGAGYQRPLAERWFMDISFNYHSATLSYPSTEIGVASTAFNLEASAQRNVRGWENSALLVGASLNPFLSLRDQDLLNFGRVFDAWTSLSVNATYIQSVGQWLGIANVSLPVLSGLITQDFANTGDHALHLTSLHITQRVKTRVGVEYRVGSTSSFGVEYNWHYWRVRVAKPIDMASHRLGIVYRHVF